MGRSTAQIGTIVFTLLLACVSAVAASLTLGCSGKLATTHIPKIGVAEDPQEDTVKAFSVVVDFDRKAVSGFWADENANLTNLWLPITSVDANGVTFGGTRKYFGGDNTINGTVDRITGAVEAIDTVLQKDGGMTMRSWELYCKPTKPLF